MTGDLNVTWIHGSPGCAAHTDPPIQEHRFDANTFILRQGKCSDPRRSFEAPFMYLLIGTRQALLLDAGASESPAVFPLAATVGRLLRDHASDRGAARPLPLIVAHSHGHGDHLAGDNQFHTFPDVTIVPPDVAGVKAFFGLPQWPEGAATFDLGDRILDIMATPGHEETHIVLFDRKTGLLLTGDTVYPGLLVVNDWAAYRRSIARLKAFSQTRPVSFVLGAHIEMTNRPGHWFGLGVPYQPGEHVLQLEPYHLVELHDALQIIGPRPRTDRHADFIIFPSDQPLPSLHP